MENRSPPILDVFVSPGCEACERTLARLAGCRRVNDLAAVRVRVLGAEDGFDPPPPGVVAGPTLVLDGVIIGLGTPRCTDLVDRIELELGHDRKNAPASHDV